VSDAEVTVIIPTLADERRGQTIWRAIDSAGPRSGVASRIIVVVNGRRFSPALLEQLRAAAGIDCIYVERGSMPLALLEGRRRVRSEFFAFLDDDDEYLEGGLATRRDLLRADRRAAFVVTAGWLQTPEGQLPQGSLQAAAIEADPLGSLLQENWVATSASGLYRSSAVTEEDFAEMPSYLEWTYLGFRLASRLPFRFLDAATYRRHDLPGTVSKSRAYHAGMVPALDAILRLSLPASVRRGLRRKLGAARHSLSVAALGEGARGEAWRQHLASLAQPGGLKYLSYTRRLLAPAPRA